MIAVITFFLGAMVAFIIATVLILELQEPLVCPLQIEAASRARLYYAELPPELTEYGKEFSEACGLEWESPVRIEPPERGA